MRRRRRGAGAVAIEAETKRGLAMRILLHSPKDMVAGALAFAAVSAIVANALRVAASGLVPALDAGMPHTVAGCLVFVLCLATLVLMRRLFHVVSARYHA